MKKAVLATTGPDWIPYLVCLFWLAVLFRTGSDRYNDKCAMEVNLFSCQT